MKDWKNSADKQVLRNGGAAHLVCRHGIGLEDLCHKSSILAVLAHEIHPHAPPHATRRKGLCVCVQYHVIKGKALVQQSFLTMFCRVLVPSRARKNGVVAVGSGFDDDFSVDWQCIF